MFQQSSSRLSRTPPSRGFPRLPRSCKSSGLTLPKVVRLGHPPARPPSPEQIPQAAVLGSIRACPLLGFPRLRFPKGGLSKRRNSALPGAGSQVSESLSWKPKLALSLMSKAWSGAGWQEVGVPAALTPVVGAQGSCSLQQLAAAAATVARQARKDFSVRPLQLTGPLPPLPQPRPPSPPSSSFLPPASSSFSSLLQLLLL